MQRVRLDTNTFETCARRQRRGYTLTEVVIASALLLVAVVVILQALTTANLNAVKIERKTKSLTLAQAKLDEIKAQSIYNFTDSFAESNLAIDGSYLCNVSDASVNSDLRAITVSVGYDENANGSLENNEVQVSLATQIARRW